MDPSVEYKHQMPLVELEIAVCRAHYFEYRQRQPERLIIVWPVQLWQQLMVDEAFQRAAGIWREQKPMPLPEDWTQTNDAMRSEPFVPWCCYLGAARRDKAWEQVPFRITAGGVN